MFEIKEIISQQYKYKFHCTATTEDGVSEGFYNMSEIHTHVKWIQKGVHNQSNSASVQKIDLDESISTIQGLLDAINDGIGSIAHFAIEEGGLVTIKFGEYSCNY